MNINDANRSHDLLFFNECNKTTITIKRRLLTSFLHCHQLIIQMPNLIANENKIRGTNEWISKYSVSCTSICCNLASALSHPFVSVSLVLTACHLTFSLALVYSPGVEPTHAPVYTHYDSSATHEFISLIYHWFAFTNFVVTLLYTIYIVYVRSPFMSSECFYWLSSIYLCSLR